MTQAAVSNNDLWISDDTQLATDTSPQNINDALSLEPEQILNPEIVSNLGEQPEPIVPPPVDEVPTEDEPTVHEFEDGSRATIEKTRKGWCATLDSGEGDPEVFYGNTKDELYTRIMAGKIHATRKIREMRRETLLAPEPEVVQHVDETPTPVQSNRLSANDIFDIKAKLEDNPDLALESWFQKRTGKTPEELLALIGSANDNAQNSQYAADDIAASQILVDWRDSSDYVNDDRNRDAIAALLLKRKARISPSRFNGPNGFDAGQAFVYLYRQDLLTIDSLDAAWEELKDEGEAITGQRRAPEPAQPAPTPQATTRRRPAAGLGIRQASSGAAPRPTPVQEDTAVESLSLEETTKLLNDIRRMKIQNPAEYERLKAIGDAKAKRG